jgi:hypothetical protein
LARQSDLENLQDRLFSAKKFDLSDPAKRYCVMLRLRSPIPGSRPVRALAVPAELGDLRAFLWSAPIAALVLDRLGAGWSDGGCAILADAVCAWLGLPTSAQVMVVDQRGAPDHLFVRVAGFAIDADGVRPAHRFLANYQRLEHLHALAMAPLDEAALARSGIPRDPALSAELAKRLRQRYPAARAALERAATSFARGEATIPRRPRAPAHHPGFRAPRA